MCVFDFVTMASEKVTAFLENYDVGKFKALKKADLLDLAARLNLEFPRTIRIRALQRELIDFFIGEGKLEEEVMDEFPVEKRRLTKEEIENQELRLAARERQRQHEMAVLLKKKDCIDYYDDFNACIVPTEEPCAIPSEESCIVPTEEPCAVPIEEPSVSHIKEDTNVENDCIDETDDIDDFERTDDDAEVDQDVDIVVNAESDACVDNDIDDNCDDVEVSTDACVDNNVDDFEIATDDVDSDCVEEAVDIDASNEVIVHEFDEDIDVNYVSSDVNGVGVIEVTEDRKEEMMVINNRSHDPTIPAWTCNETDGVHGPGPPKQFTLVPRTSANLGTLLWHAFKPLTDDMCGPGPPLWSWMTVLWSACQVTPRPPPDPWPPPVVTFCVLIIQLGC